MKIAERRYFITIERENDQGGTGTVSVKHAATEVLFGPQGLYYSFDDEFTSNLAR